MFNSSRKTMRWSSLLKDIKEKVGLSPHLSSSSSSPPPPPPPPSAAPSPPSAREGHAAAGPASPARADRGPVPAERDKHDLETDFKIFWEEFRSSSSEKDKEMSLNMAVDIFCRLLKRKTDVSQLVTTLVEAHIFSFVIGRAFVTDIEKLRIYNKTKSLNVGKVLIFFSEETHDGFSPGSNLLYAVEVLVSAPIDKQPLLDSGIFCCLIHILNALLNPDEDDQTLSGDTISSAKTSAKNTPQDRRFQVEGSVVHIMKALASHPLAAISLIEDDSLQLLFQMVANGSLFKTGRVHLHSIQLHRHAMQILGLLLVNDNGSTAKYIHKHHLIKVLLMALKDFNPDEGDSSYTMGIVDLLLECVELSNRPDAGSVRLREDIHNAHGYQFLVQFALTLSRLQKNHVPHTVHSNILVGDTSGTDTTDASTESFTIENDDNSSVPLSPCLSRLLDVLVNLAQTGNGEPVGLPGRRGVKSNNGKSSSDKHRIIHGDKTNEEIWEKNSFKIHDLEAIQMLQDIFLKSDCVELQAEVLNRIFKIFSSHPENYMLCQQLRTVPLFILNMASFPVALQEIILKVLEYAVTVANCVPEQELLSLCCLLQQPTTSNLKQAILVFFVKLISFDQQYKKVLREVGVLEVLIDDLKQHRFIFGVDSQNKDTVNFEMRSTSQNFRKAVDSKDVVISSPKLNSMHERFSVFENEATISVAWDCLVALLKKAEANQSYFRTTNGFTTVLPFLISDIHRSGLLRVMACLMIEDVKQVHPEELGAVIEILKSGMITNPLGSQFKLFNDATCDILGTVWRILVANNSAQRIFGEVTGFSLLLTTLHGFQCDNDAGNILASLDVQMKVFSFLLRAITAAVNNNAVNRLRLHAIISSQTFCDLLLESSLLCADWEGQIVQLLLELALEVILPPPTHVSSGNASSSVASEAHTADFLSSAAASTFKPDKERIYNSGAVGVLIHCLLKFTPKLQIELLAFIEKLASAGPFNQESLTSIGCVGLLLEMIHPFLAVPVLASSSLLQHTLRIVQVLGAYRLSTSELRMIIRYILQYKSANSSHYLVEMMEKLIQVQETRLDSVSPAPFVEMDLSRMGHSSVQVSLGERTWPPAAGYSFVCWFQYHISKGFSKEHDQQLKTGSSRNINTSQPIAHLLRFFSVGSVDDCNSFYAELFLDDNGVLTLSTSNSSSLSFSGLDLEEGKWHHLAVVHSKPNALAGLFQASIANVYLNGRLRHTGKLGYSPSPVGKSLQVTIGTPLTRAKVCDLSWRFRCCYLFEEVLTSGGICFMYILGKGYRGIFQDTDLLQFVPDQACGGGSMAILDSLDIDPSIASSALKIDNAVKQGNLKLEGSGIVWDLEKLRNLSLQIIGKKLIFAFDGTSSEAFKASGALSMLNLVDPLSAAASPIGGIPRFGRLSGDSYICHQCVIGDSIRAVGGVAVILFLIEASESRDMLHASLSLLACALQQNPRNVLDMQACRGYHLLAIFLRRKMPLFDMQLLDIFFQIAACEASFFEPQRLVGDKAMSPVKSPEATFEDLSLQKLSDEISSVGSQGDLEDFSIQKDSISHLSELENVDIPETANCIVLSNADMVEHVLLDWTLWVTAPVSVQLSLLGFLERMVSMHWYRNHNLTLLRRINLVQHLLVTLQRGDVEVQVLEKLVVLLGVILEDGFLVSELEIVVRFVIMTFDPPGLRSRQQIVRETMGKHVIVRNMLLEMLIDLQVTITFDEQLEQWHKIVSSKLVTCFLDEAVHPTSMRWIMTLLGVCLTSSPMFVQKFRTSGGYQVLNRVLPGFYDSPEIYYTIFCLIFNKDVYPRVPEVRMGDFHALMSSDGYYGELKFTELLDCVVSMAKSTFDRLSMQAMHLYKNDNITQFSASLVAELVEAANDIGGDLQVEALKHKTSARLMGGDATAPATATSILRFMVDLAKMCSSFSAICRRKEFLDTCVDLYFSCVRSGCAVKMAKSLASGDAEKCLLDTDDNQSTLQTMSGMLHEHEQSSKTTTSIRSFPHGLYSTSSEDTSCMQISLPRLKESALILHSFDAESADQASLATSSTCDISYCDTKTDPDTVSAGLSSPVAMEKSNLKTLFSPLSSPAPAFTSSLGSAGNNSGSRAQFMTAFSMKSSASEVDTFMEPKISTQGLTSANTFFPMNPKLLLEIDDLGYGGGPCSAGATAVLDLIAIVLADIIAEQVKGSLYVEGILETVPLYVDMDTLLIFQGLCMSRLMNFLERRLLRDDEEDEKKLEKSRWSTNLDALSCMIVDRIYMGAFSRPVDVLRTLEFLLSMLQLANKDGRIEEILPLGKSLLSITKGTRQLEPYILALLKNANRMIMYCFLPSFLAAIGEDGLISCLGFSTESWKPISLYTSADEHNIDICTVLQLVIANKRLLLCPSNLDSDLICCLCVNLFSLLRDQRQFARHSAVDIIKYLLSHRRGALEELLITKSNQGDNLNVFHGGFDLLLTGSTSEFFEWFYSSEQVVNKALEQNASLMWLQYMSGPAKLPVARIKTMEGRRKSEMGKKSREVSKLDLRHWEQISERRYALELVRDAMSTELRVIRQDKYGWVLHAESEWEAHQQQLVHDRGIFPINIFSVEPEWQLCPIEGPYRMRKKLERCKFKAETIQNVLIGLSEKDGKRIMKDKDENGSLVSESDSERFFNLPSDGGKENGFDVDHDYGTSFFKDAEDYRGEESISTEIGWNDDRGSSVNEFSLHSVPDIGAKSTSSVPITDGLNVKSELGSPRISLSIKVDDPTAADDKLEKELNDNGEYLIRPYLEPLEKIRFKYNCERVTGLDKHDGIFLIGELSLYVIENFFIDDFGCICEKQSEDDLSIIDQALGVKKDVTGSSEFQSKSPSTWVTAMKALVGGRAWAYNGGAWGKEKICSSGNLHHPWHMWKLDSIHELLKRDYQLRPVAIEIFSMDGCNDLLVFHKKEREEVFRNLVSMNLPRNIMDATISGLSKQESNEGSRLFKSMAKSFSKRWQNGEISNFQYLMHLNTLAGRGYRDLTQYPVFPWVLADYESEMLDMSNPKSFRKLDKPMGCQTVEGEEEFKKRYESWDDPDVPKFHYGSHYSSAGIVLFYLLRLPPFSIENQKLQGGQFDHADRLFNSVRDTWLSAAGKGNTSDVKELIPEFFYMPEFLENRFNLDLGEKQSGEKVGDVVLPPWANGSAREFIKKHREALESDYVSENLHNWIDLIFGYKQRGKAAEEAVNVFYHYTYEGNVDIDAVSDPAMKASILAQINHFGQTPKQLFFKPHVKRRVDRKIPPHLLRYSSYLAPREVRKYPSLISQIVSFHEKILVSGPNNLIKPVTHNKYIAWGFPDRSLRFLSYDQDKLLSTHESLHGGNQIQCAGITQDGHVLVTGADDGVVLVWRISKDGVNTQRHLHLERSLCSHTAKITCLYVSQPYSIIVTGADDCTVILWDLSSLVFVKQLPQFPAPVSAVHVNDLTGEIVTAAGILLAIWSINGDCLAVVNTSQLPSDCILSVATAMYSDWQDTNWYVTGHQSGAVKIWNMVHCSTEEESGRSKLSSNATASFGMGGRTPEYRLVLRKVLKVHKHPVRALLLTPDRKQLLSGDEEGHLLSWTLPDERLESLRASINQG